MAARAPSFRWGGPPSHTAQPPGNRNAWRSAGRSPEKRFREGSRHGNSHVLKHESRRSYSIFVDGLKDTVTRAMLGAIFGKVGRLCSIYVPHRKKEGRRFRFAFLRYDSELDARKAIRMFNGMKLEGAYLVVKKEVSHHRHSGEDLSFQTRIIHSVMWFEERYGSVRWMMKCKKNRRKTNATQMECTMWIQMKKNG